MELGAVGQFGELDPGVDIILMPFLEISERVIFVDVVKRELIDYYQNEEVQHYVLLDHNENYEIHLGIFIPSSSGPPAVEHYSIPVLPSRHAEQKDERLVEIRKIRICGHVILRLDWAE